MNWFAYIVTVLAIFAWDCLIIGGCAYLVFWRGESGWWFLLAVVFISADFPEPFPNANVSQRKAP